MDAVSPPPRPAQGLLRNRNFVLLAAGQAIARVGDGLYVTLLAWAAWKISHRPGAVALAGLAATAPSVAATVIGASLADRFDRRRLMIAADLGRCLLIAVTSLLAADGLLGVWSLAGLAAATGIAGAAFTPARGGADPGRPAPALISAAQHFGPPPPGPRGKNAEPVNPVSTERSTTCCP